MAKDIQVLAKKYQASYEVSPHSLAVGERDGSSSSAIRVHAGRRPRQRLVHEPAFPPHEVHRGTQAPAGEQHSGESARGGAGDCGQERRVDAGGAWFSGVLPLDRFRIVDGTLMFEDLGAPGGDGNGRDYSIRWASHDGSGRATPLPDATGSHVPAFRDDAQHLTATLQPAANEPGDDPVTVYIRRGPTGPEVVGIDR